MNEMKCSDWTRRSLDILAKPGKQPGCLEFCALVRNVLYLLLSSCQWGPPGPDWRTVTSDALHTFQWKLLEIVFLIKGETTYVGLIFHIKETESASVPPSLARRR